MKRLYPNISWSKLRNCLVQDFRIFDFDDLSARRIRAICQSDGVADLLARNRARAVGV